MYAVIKMCGGRYNERSYPGDIIWLVRPPPIPKTNREFSPFTPSVFNPQFKNLLHMNVQRFRSGLVFQAHRLLYCSTLDLRVIKRKMEQPPKVGPSPRQQPAKLQDSYFTEMCSSSEASSYSRLIDVCITQR